MEAFHQDKRRAGNGSVELTHLRFSCIRFEIFGGGIGLDNVKCKECKVEVRSKQIMVHGDRLC